MDVLKKRSVGGTVTMILSRDKLVENLVVAVRRLRDAKAEPGRHGSIRSAVVNVIDHLRDLEEFDANDGWEEVSE